MATDLRACRLTQTPVNASACQYRRTYVRPPGLDGSDVAADGVDSLDALAGEHHSVAEWTALATHPDTGELIEWDGIDLIQVRDGRICRNAVYSAAHRARPQGSAWAGADT
jgi:hypothetical protein